MDAIERKIRKKFGTIWPVHVKSLTQFLINCRSAFDGDIDMFLVLAVIGDRTFSERKADPDLSYEQWQAGKGPKTTPEDINVRSIAAFSGIPRETVRRKLKVLLERGWIDRTPEGHLRATRNAAIELEPMTLVSIQYLVQMFRLFQKVGKR